MKCIIVFLLLFSNRIHAWNTCSDEPFCDRIRNQQSTSQITLDKESLTTESNKIEATLINEDTGRNLKLEISATENGIFRFTIDDATVPRFRASQALNGDPAVVDIDPVEGDDDIEMTVGDIKVVLQYSPFKISIYYLEELAIVINEQNYITFNSEDDDKSIAIDFSFPTATTAYGIPEHAESLSLKSTASLGLDPYRLYSSDYPGYDISTQEALYGAVPVLYGHGLERTSGIFWLNSAQTFVDIEKTESEGVRALFISESGIMDIFALPGPTLDASVKQYVSLTGTAPLPQYYTLGHHQCRWSYMSQEDVETVVEKFDEFELPFDVIWLDIDYTNGYRYFTWNTVTFPNPVAMQEKINDSGRKAVMIVDPHIKVDSDYFVWETANAEGYFVKDSNGDNYEAECWPGLSSWLDFFNTEAVEYYVSLFSMDNYEDVTDIVQIWNDMNEPAVFEVDEKTFPRDLVHSGDILHRDVHNMYGFTQTVATYRALRERYGDTQRPFTLTRSHFAGNQRYSAVWTGDNLASWEHLRISFPMCLTEAISGISFCGADVGGFSGNPSEELAQRWYQAGAWLPFFRAHSDMYAERREPYLYESDEVVDRIRDALNMRYSFLPVWYTLFYEHERYGNPVIVPISYHYPSEPETLEMDDQWLVGRDILVHPVAEESAEEVEVYLPGGSNEIWFDITNNLAYQGYGYYKIAVTMDSVPVYHRGGSIIAKKNVVRQSSAFTHSDPYTIYVFLDVNDEATGTLYIDDFESFKYQNGEYHYYTLDFKENKLSVVETDVVSGLPAVSHNIDEIYIYGANTDAKEAVTDTKSKHKVSYNHDRSHMKLTDLNLALKHGAVIEII